jgi:integrase
MCVPRLMPPATSSAPAADAGRPLRAIGDREAVLIEYACWLDARGRGCRSFRDGARAFLDRWPDPQSFAAEPLAVQLGCDQHVRPFITFLLLTDRLRPGYDYLVHRKFASLLKLAVAGRLAEDLKGFQHAAAELGFSPHVRERSAERVICRLLLQTGRQLRGLAVEDLRALETAFRSRAEDKGVSPSNDLGFLHAAWVALYHLGVVTVTPPNRRRREHADEAHHFGGVPAWLAGRLVRYTERLSGTHRPSTISGIAIRLAHFGRFLAAHDSTLCSLADLDRQQHVEPYLAATAVATVNGSDRAISVGEQRNRVITLGRFLADISEWGWPDAPARRLVFPRDVPRASRPLPRYLPPEQDRRLQEALVASENRLVADALLLARATGLRVGELVDLELDCVHELPGQGAWLKVPLGKLGSERMVPLDEETVQIIDRIVEQRSPCGALPHPRTGHLAEFLLCHHGKRLSIQALRDELARTATTAGIGHVTPHRLRHTYATALVNAGCSLQALMELLGHVSAAMSLRYGKLFDQTVRADYERALEQAKAQIAQPLQGSSALPITQIASGDGDWRAAPLIKARLAGGYCVRTAAQGVCPYTNVCEHCPNYRTDAAFMPILAAQRQDAELLAADAEQRGWGQEATRHRRLIDRLDQLIDHAQEHCA